MMYKYAIVSLERKQANEPSLFCAIHGYSPFYVREASKTKKFGTAKEAGEYAMKELFNNESAFSVIVVSAN
jgi:hypothetical protein